MAQAPPYTWIKSYPEGIAWDAKLNLCPLPDMLEEAAGRWPGRTSLDFMGKKTSFAELLRQVETLAFSLQGMGVEKGIHVGIFMPNCPQFIITYYAILKAGGTVVNLNPLYAQRDIEHEIDDANVGIVFTLALDALYSKLKEAMSRTKLETLVVSGLDEAMPWYKAVAFRFTRKADIAAIPRDKHHHAFASLVRGRQKSAKVDIDPLQDVAVLQYTGGTTGVPKAAMLTHANLTANVQQCGYWFAGLKEGEETLMGVIPFFHSFSMTAVMNLGIHKGAKLIIHPKFDLAAVLHDIEKYRPSLMCGVPTMFVAINNYRSIERHDLSSLRVCVSGGAPLPVEVKQRFEQLSGARLIEGYGLSETSPVASANPLFGLNKEGSIGLPLPHTVMEIIDLEDKTTLKNIGEEGEICITGPQVMKGYWHKPEETENVLKNGRLHTGDIGKMDEDGYFYVVDRLKEMIIAGGYNIYPRNIEEVIYQHPEVVEAAVIGIHHEQRGQVPKAFVVKKEGSALTEVQLKQFLKDKLASFSLPAKIEFRDTLPKTLVGKIDKKALKS